MTYFLLLYDEQICYANKGSEIEQICHLYAKDRLDLNKEFPNLKCSQCLAKLV